MNNLNTITQDWTHADQFLNDKIDKNNNSIKHDFDELTSDVNTRFTSVENEVKMLNGTADGQFIYDTEAKMTKVVPDGVNKGIVSMVGGKTRKCKNLWKYGDFINIPSQRFVVEDSSVSFIKNGKTYTFSLNISGTELGSAFELQFRNGSNVVKSISGGKGFTSSTFTINSVVDNIRFYVNPANYTNIQLEESSSVTPYEPYHEDLWNAPVKNVSLTGRNLWNEKWEIGAINDTNGENYPNADRIRSVDYINVEPNTKYYITRNESDSTGLAFYDSSKHFISYLVISGATKTFTTPTNATKIRFFMSSSYGKTYKNDIAIIKGENGVYEPYRKTTLSLERIVDNLPDYGIEGNYIDFENMVYHHRVSIADLSSLTWLMFSDTLFYSSPIGMTTDLQYGVECNRYNKSITTSFRDTEDGCIGHGRPIYTSSGGSFAVRDSNYSTVTDFKNSLNGVFATYKIPEELIPLTDLLLPFKCEPGGTVTFENEHNLDVPNTIIYEKEMK